MDGLIEVDVVIKKKEELSAEVERVNNNLVALKGAVAILDLLLREYEEGPRKEEDPSKIN